MSGNAQAGQGEAQTSDQARNSDQAMASPSLDDLTDAIRSDNVVGTPVYTSNTYIEDGWELDTSVEIDTDWDQIGDIASVVIMPDGQMAGLIVEVGGFLDIGDKHVFVHKKDLQMLDGSNAEEAYFATRMTADQLRELPEVGEEWYS